MISRDKARKIRVGRNALKQRKEGACMVKLVNKHIKREARKGYSGCSFLMNTSNYIFETFVAVKLNSCGFSFKRISGILTVFWGDGDMDERN